MSVEVMNEEERAIPAERVRETGPERELPIIEGSALLGDENDVAAELPVEPGYDGEGEEADEETEGEAEKEE
jgi:hypothetical protein